jgi:hypothetical protein
LLISPIMPLSNIARNCFKQGRVEDMTARCVVIVVVIVTATLVEMEWEEREACWMYSRRRPMGMMTLEDSTISRSIMR